MLDETKQSLNSKWFRPFDKGEIFHYAFWVNIHITAAAV